MHLIAWRGEGFVFVGLTAANCLVPSGGQINPVPSNGMTKNRKTFHKNFSADERAIVFPGHA